MSRDMLAVRRIHPSLSTGLIASACFAVVACSGPLSEASRSCDDYAARVATLPLDGLEISEGLGMRMASAVVHADGIDYELTGEWSDDEAVTLQLRHGDEVPWRFELSEGEFHVTYVVDGVTHSESWARPHGDMVEFLDLWQPPSYSGGPYAGPFVGAPLHRVGLSSMQRVLDQLDSDLSVDRLVRASEVYALAVGGPVDEAAECANMMARSATSDHREPDGTAGEADAETPGHDRPGDTHKLPEQECTIRDAKKAEGGSITASITGLATLSVTAANVEVSAYCDSPQGCLEADANQDWGLDANISGAGGGCPSLPSYAEPMRTERVISADASVGDGCAKSGSKDKATAFKATLSGGNFTATIEGPNAEGDGIGGEAWIKGTAIVCWEDDLVFDDLTNVILSGKTKARIY